MKNIIDICKEFGIEIPAEKHADFLKAVNGEYKTIAEHGKVLEKLNTATKRAETAEEALKGFEGLGDAADVKKQLEDANQKIKEAQEAAQKQIDERDYNDALKLELDSVKFSSTAARKAVEAEIRNSGLKLKNGKILGLSDLLDQMKKEDASAFVDDKTPPPARFDDSGNRGNQSVNSVTPKDILKVRDHADRQKAWAQYLTNHKGDK